MLADCALLMLDGRTFYATHGHVHNADNPPPLKDGDVLKIGDESLRVIHTPGHSEGSVCFFCPEMKIAFTGDVVFRDETGYTIFDGGSKHQMINSIGSIIDKWDDDTVLYPGHFGMADMAYVKANNPDYRKAMKRYTEK